MKYSAVLSIILFVLYSCGPSSIYEQHKEFDTYGWQVDDVKEFNFRIPDPSKKYDLYYQLRYTSDYEKYNHYFKHFLEDTTHSIISSELNVANLFDSKTGKPIGKGFSDTYDLEVLILQDQEFPVAGNYIAAFQHYMRYDTLKGVKAVGLKVLESQP